MFYQIENSRFKNNLIALNFKIDNQDYFKALLLAKVITSYTQSFPSDFLLQNYLFKLYASKIVASVGRIGKATFFSINITYLNQDFTKELILDKLLNILTEILSDFPLTEKDLKIAKYTHQEEVQEFKNDIKSFASYQALLKATSNKYLSEDLLSDESYLNLSLTELNDFKAQIKNFEVLAIADGKFSNQELELLDDLKLNYSDFKISAMVDVDESEVSFNQEIKDYKVVSQSSVINIYYYPKKLLSLNDQANLLLAAYILSDNLNQDVREKHGLCYYIRARVTKAANLFYVNTGVNQENIAKTKELIIQHLNDLANHKIDLNHFEDLKNRLLCSMELEMENRYYHLDALFTKIIFNRNYDHLALTEEIKKLEIKDLAETVKVLSPILSYEVINNE